MAKKSDKMAATYARKSVTPKKKRPLRSDQPKAVSAPFGESKTPAPVAAPQVRPVARASASAGAAYEYVMADLKKVVIIAVVLFATLIILSFVL